MFVSEKIVFIQLQKTGCSHIGKLLSQCIEGQQIPKHHPATPDLFTKQRAFWGSIRNPWEWYVSLWAYGCDKKGAVYSSTTGTQLWKRGWRKNPLGAAHSLLNGLIRHPTSNHDKWKRCYADVHDASGFRTWLGMMHDRNYWEDFGEKYSSYPIREFAGLLTYRYIKLFCLGNFKDITSLDGLKNFEQHKCYIDYFVRNEYLERDLMRGLESCGIELSEAQKNVIYSARRTNTSSKKERASYYYDSDTIDIIYNRERLIIDKFNYIPPALMNMRIRQYG